MFVSDALIFVELHKTGGTHIGHWLQQLVGGEQIGKHNRVPPEWRHRFILGSIRNPWDWYVSLWAFGCGGEGSVRRQVTRRIDLGYCRRQLAREMGKRRLSLTEWKEQLAADWNKPVEQWSDTYRSAEDPEAFRTWLRLMMDPDRRLDMGEGFGHSPVARSAGLLSYRYLKLFTDLDDELYTDSRLALPEVRWEICETRSIVDHVIRNESLEADLLAGLDRAGVRLTEVQRSALQAGSESRINRSRRRDTAYYYDQSTIELVADREALIIARYGYVPPIC